MANEHGRALGSDPRSQTSWRRFAADANTASNGCDPRSSPFSTPEQLRNQSSLLQVGASQPVDASFLADNSLDRVRSDDLRGPTQRRIRSNEHWEKWLPVRL